MLAIRHKMYTNVIILESAVNEAAFEVLCNCSNGERSRLC